MEPLAAQQNATLGSRRAGDGCGSDGLAGGIRDGAFIGGRRGIRRDNECDQGRSGAFLAQNLLVMYSFGSMMAIVPSAMDPYLFGIGTLEAIGLAAMLWTATR